MDINVAVRPLPAPPPREFVVTLVLSDQEGRLLRAMLGNTDGSLHRKAIDTALLLPPTGKGDKGVQDAGITLARKLAQALTDAFEQK